MRITFATVSYPDAFDTLKYLANSSLLAGLGNLAWTKELEWPGQKAYAKAPLEDLKLQDDGSKIGAVKSSGNFTFISIHAGGHMVPHDQPAASLDMLNRWLNGEWIES